MENLKSPGTESLDSHTDTDYSKKRSRVDSGYESTQSDLSVEDGYWLHRTAKDLAKLMFSLGLADSINETVEKLEKEEAQQQEDLVESVIRSKKPKRKAKKVLPYCVFCKNNDESNYQLWSSHMCKDQFDHVVCPVLRHYHCPHCKATGDWAHTIRYCPVKKEEELKALEVQYNSSRRK